MDIFPEDLGVSNYQGILSQRARLRGLWRTTDVEIEQTLDSLSSVHRRWIGGSDIDEQNAKCAHPAFALCHLWQQAVVFLTILAFVAICTIAGYMWFQSGLLLAEIVAPIAAIILASGLFYGNITLPRRIFDRLHDKVSDRDVARLRKNVADPLKETYFNVTLDVMKLPQQIEKTLAQNIRHSLHALGNAIDDVQSEEHERSFSGDDKDTDSPRLDAAMKYLNDVNLEKAKRKKVYTQPVVQRLLSDSTELRELAQKFSSEAATENDPIVAASIKRRSDSLIHQANTIDQIRTLNRRNKALRDEISQQMNSLSTRLNASYLMRGQAATGMADMFDQITHLASEASQVAAAQEELASVLTRH